MIEDGSACIYCGATDDLTDDHVPPENIFPKPKSSDLITVPACKPCNRGFSLDNEYFRIAILGPAALRSPVARALWEGPVERGLRRSVDREAPFATEFLLSRRESEVKDATGRVIGTSVGRRIEPARIDRTVARIVRGLLWHKHRYRLSRQAAFNVTMGPRIGGAASEQPDYIADQILPADAPLRSIGGGIFEYRYRILDNQLEHSDWFLRFYGLMTFWVSVVPESAAPPTDSCQPMR